MDAETAEPGTLTAALDAAQAIGDAVDALLEARRDLLDLDLM